jgi:hypothetical protein
VARECSEVNLVFAPVIRRRSKGQRAVHSRTRCAAPIRLIVTVVSSPAGSSPDSERGTGQPPVLTLRAGWTAGMSHQHPVGAIGVMRAVVSVKPLVRALSPLSAVLLERVAWV